jgi:hypothetical protein
MGYEHPDSPNAETDDTPDRMCIGQQQYNHRGQQLEEWLTTQYKQKLHFPYLGDGEFNDRHRYRSPDRNVRGALELPWAVRSTPPRNTSVHRAPPLTLRRT